MSHLHPASRSSSHDHGAFVKTTNWSWPRTVMGDFFNLVLWLLSILEQHFQRPFLSNFFWVAIMLIFYQFWVCFPIFLFDLSEIYSLKDFGWNPSLFSFKFLNFWVKPLDFLATHILQRQEKLSFIQSLSCIFWNI